MKSAISEAHFHNEVAAFAYIEARLWLHGPVCKHCGGTERIGALKGKTTRAGLYKCYACRKPFTVRMGTVFEASHIPMRFWLQAIYLMASSKKGISTRQLQRTFECSMTTAWFMSNRIREAMKSLGFDAPMGGEGGIVEIDEAFIGTMEGKTVERGYRHKNTVLSLVERRPAGAVIRSFHVASSARADILPVIQVHVSPATHVMTDEGAQYRRFDKFFAEHDFTMHGKGEYVRDSFIHTNTVEGYYSVFRRGMVGVYQHCTEHHLHRYVAEFDFRYNNWIKLGVDDKTRADLIVSGAKGKRLTYRTVAGTAAA